MRPPTVTGRQALVEGKMTCYVTEGTATSEGGGATLRAIGFRRARRPARSHKFPPEGEGEVEAVENRVIAKTRGGAGRLN